MMSTRADAGLILLVEDESHIAEGLQYNLEAMGHAVDVAADGLQALDYLADAERRHDLVILDLMLPEVSGYEILRRVRAAGNRVPILILTAKDDRQDLLRGLEEGADDYLCKPFDLDELLARVRGLLRRRRGFDALRTTSLVHETYLKLAHRGGAVCRDRGHFLALAARAMRWVLLEES